MGSAAFNILNANYEDNNRGNQLKERDDLRHCRDQARSAHMEYAGGCQFNPINGSSHAAIGNQPSEVY